MKKKPQIIFLLCITNAMYSQASFETKAQPSNFLSKAYYSINFGGIFYPFSNDNLIEGHKTNTYSKNYFSGRVLLAYKITPRLAAQFGTFLPKIMAWQFPFNFRLEKHFKLNYEHPLLHK